MLRPIIGRLDSIITVTLMLSKDEEITSASAIISFPEQVAAIWMLEGEGRKQVLVIGIVFVDWRWDGDRQS